MGRVFGRFLRKENRRQAAGGWYRVEGSDFTKVQRLGDGGVVSLMVGKISEDELDHIYSELKDTSRDRTKNLTWMFFAYSFAIMAFFDVPGSLRIFGMEIKTEAFPHAAIALITFFSWKYSTFQTRFSYSSAYFEHLYYNSDPYKRAYLLLRYPSAFPAMQFNRTIRGFPSYVWPTLWPWWESFALKVLLFAITFSAIIPFTIFGIGIYSVWMSNFPTSIYARIYVGLVLFLGLFVVANPSFTSLKRNYRHFGLSNLLSQTSEERKRAYHALIARMRFIREEGHDQMNRH